MLFPNDYANVTFGTNSRIPVIANIKYDDDDINNVVLVVDNQIVGVPNHFQGDFSTNRYFEVSIQVYQVSMFIRSLPLTI